SPCSFFLQPRWHARERQARQKRAVRRLLEPSEFAPNRPVIGRQRIRSVRLAPARPTPTQCRHSHRAPPSPYPSPSAPALFPSHHVLKPFPIAPLLLPPAPALPACGGGGGGGGGGVTAVLLIGDAPVDDLLAFSAVVNSVRLQRDDLSFTGDL